MVAKLRTLACSALLLALVLALARTFTGGGTLGRPGPLHGWYLADGLLFASALLLALLGRGLPERAARSLVLLGSAAVTATGLLAPPRTSDDVYRYVWDGQVQAAGISPYAYTPVDPALARLRAQAPALFPPRAANAPCVGWDLHHAAQICTHINRPTVHTIYPPVAEIWFLLLHTLGGTVRVAQLLGALLAVGVTAVLLRMLRARRAPAAWAGLWAWCPGVAIWSVNDAHVDTLGVLLALLGLAAAASGRRPGIAGALLGAATAVKLIPAVVVPGTLARRRGRLRLTAAAALTFAVAYLPYVAASGLGVIGFLPGYLQQEGYDQGGRFALLALLPVPQARLGLVAAVVLAGVALAVALRGDPERPWRGALTVTGTALLLATPSYPWYSLLLLALAALECRWEWLGVPVAGLLDYLYEGDVRQPAYLAALGLVLAGSVWRSRSAGFGFRRAGRPDPRPSPAAARAAGTASSASAPGSTRAG
ncbi:glycosyltransferase 87 family protein [Streptacidiphilus melanogenes]|uniref:glycosyltransferase 87 family protein n=1 Tax=Streptacidiphilus melanogenes TaxID=411235 RepID=UPI0007C67C47|nr:glycosyltransferase 87 family protein [Streptacidiphilus melanogenes]